MPQATQFAASALTPGRQSQATFDIEETLPVEVAYLFHREAEHAQFAARSNVIKLASGCIVLRPLNDIDVNRETADGQSGVCRKRDWTTTTAVAEVPRQRAYTELTGATISGSVISAGDYWLKKRIAAGASWDNNLAGHSSPASEIFGVSNYQVDRVAHTTEEHEQNQGYLLRLRIAGSFLQNSDFLFGFAFGGPIYGPGGSGAGFSGYGEFWLAMMGDGTAILHEKVNGTWLEVNRWRAWHPAAVVDHELILRIFPHPPLFIEFATLASPVATPGAGYGNLAEAAYASIKEAQKDSKGAGGAFVHSISNRVSTTDPNTHLIVITGRGNPAMDLPQNFTGLWQINRLTFPETGSFTDRPFKVGDGLGSAHVIQPQAYGYNQFRGATAITGYAISLENYDGTALATGTEAYTWRGVDYSIPGFYPNGDSNRIRAVVTMTASNPAPRYFSPTIVAYEARRNGHGQTVSGSAVTGGKLMSFNSSGAGYDPDHETASLVVEDTKNELAFLRARGNASVRVETTYDPADATKKAVLFEGYIGRVTATRKGKTGFTYPSAQWRHLDIECLGKWYRLRGQFFTDYQRYDNRDLNAPTQPLTSDFNPWKVTDAIRQILKDEGYDEAQLDIFDDDIRLFLTGNGGTQTLIVPPGTEKSSYCKAIARDYLNAFLVWDANAGAGGMWRLRRPPMGTETAQWEFSTSLPTGKLAHRGAGWGGQNGAYGARTSPILGHPWNFDTWIIPPEGNVLTVTGCPLDLVNGENSFVQRQIINFESFDSPTHGAADTTHIDYIGWIKPIEYVDHTLGNKDDLTEAQKIVDFVARRVFNLACRGRKYFEFVSELVLLDTDGSGSPAHEPDIYTTRKARMLLPGDTVTIDGERCVIHSCAPFYDSDLSQKQRVTAELFRYQNTFDSKHAIQTHHEMLDRRARKAVGVPPRALWRLGAGTARGAWSAEHMSLPVHSGDMPVIQGPTSGVLKFQVGFDAVGDADHPVA